MDVKQKLEILKNLLYDLEDVSEHLYDRSYGSYINTLHKQREKRAAILDFVELHWKEVSNANLVS